MNGNGSEGSLDLRAALSAPFPPEVVEWKAQTTRGERALAVAYVDARAVMDRLDDVMGPANWQDAYTVLPDGNVVCRLSLRLDGAGWVTKEDVGGESDQQDDGDKRKAAFSDALKRAAVKWGISRYLYRLPPQWVDYDPQKKQLRGTPRLPDWALPGKAPAEAHRVPAAAPAAPQAGGLSPAQFQVWVLSRDADLAAAGRSKPGQLVAAVVAAGRAEGYSDDLASWPRTGYPVARQAIKAFEATHVGAAKAG